MVKVSAQEHKENYKEVLNSLDRSAACALIGDWFVNS
jgi:hypothetical protein